MNASHKNNSNQKPDSHKINEFFNNFWNSSWTSFWFRDREAYPVAAFRIAFGIYLFIFFARHFPFVEQMFSNQGVYSAFWITDLAPGLIVAWVIYFCTLALISLFTLGVKTSIVTPLLLLNYLYYYFLNFAVKNTSYDRLIIIFLLILCFGKLNRVWSLRKSKNDSQNKTKNTSTTCAFVTQLLCVQVSIFYFGAGIYKLFQPAWSNGEILRMTMASSWGTPFAFWLLKQNIPTFFYDIATFVTIIFEISMGVFIWFRPLQKFLFPLGIFFHLSIWFLLSIPEFMICTTTYVLFMNPDSLKRFGEMISNFTMKLFRQKPK